MEAKCVEMLRQYGSVRAFLLGKLFYFVPKAILEHNATFHILLGFSTLSIIISIFATTRSLTLFSLHPICMTIGTFIFLGEGIVAYRNNSLLEMLSPIMQHNKKTKVRAIHQTLQTIGAVFLALGILFITANKFENHKSIIPISPHAILGTIALLFILGQVASGFDKVYQMDKNNRKTRRWHGQAGLLTWDALLLTVLVGLASFLPIRFTNFLVLLMVIIVWLALHAQMDSCKSINYKYDSSPTNSLSAVDILNSGSSSNNNNNNNNSKSHHLHQHSNINNKNSAGGLLLQTASSSTASATTAAALSEDAAAAADRTAEHCYDDNGFADDSCTLEEGGRCSDEDNNSNSS